MRYVLLKICHHKWKLLQVTDKKYLSAETQAITNIHGRKGHYLEGEGWCKWREAMFKFS